MNKEPEHIVILGAGFGGLYAYLQLNKLFRCSADRRGPSRWPISRTDAENCRVKVTLVSETDCFLFVPLIHEVATGTLKPRGVTQSLEVLPKADNFSVTLGGVESVDLDKRTVRVKGLENPLAHAGPRPDQGRDTRYSLGNVSKQGENLTIKYDYLISALGSMTNFFGTPGAAEYCLTLKNLEDAKRIKNAVIERFEEANKQDFRVSCYPELAEGSPAHAGPHSWEMLRQAQHDKMRVTCKCESPDKPPSLGVWRQTPSLLGKEGELRFVVVGGGPTGVELAGELADLINHELVKAFPKLKGLAEVVLIHAADKLVPQVDEWFHEKASKILEKKGVRVLCNTRVTKVTGEGVELSKAGGGSGSPLEKRANPDVSRADITSLNFFESKTIIWTAGMKARGLEVKARQTIEKDEYTGRIKVTNYLNLPNYKTVFIVGDQAWIHDKEAGQPYPMRAQFAVREGQVAACNIVRMIEYSHHSELSSESNMETLKQVQGDKKKIELEEFFWKDQGFILSLGKGRALAEAFGMHFSGPFAWWVYRTVYLFKLVGWRAKLATAWCWTGNLFRLRDISKL